MSFLDCSNRVSSNGCTHEVELVRHQAAGHDSHRDADAGLAHDPDEGPEVLVLLEHPGPRIAPVDHVTAIPSGRGSCRSRHSDLQANEAQE